MRHRMCRDVTMRALTHGVGAEGIPGQGEHDWLGGRGLGRVRHRPANGVGGATRDAGNLQTGKTFASNIIIVLILS